jgi:hypothetical protein
MPDNQFGPQCHFILELPFFLISTRKNVRCRKFAALVALPVSERKREAVMNFLWPESISSSLTVLAAIGSSL